MKWKTKLAVPVLMMALLTSCSMGNVKFDEAAFKSALDSAKIEEVDTPAPNVVIKGEASYYEADDSLDLQLLNYTASPKSYTKAYVYSNNSADNKFQYEMIFTEFKEQSDAEAAYKEISANLKGTIVGGGDTKDGDNYVIVYVNPSHDTKAKKDEGDYWFKGVYMDGNNVIVINSKVTKSTLKGYEKDKVCEEMDIPSPLSLA